MDRDTLIKSIDNWTKLVAEADESKRATSIAIERQNNAERRVVAQIKKVIGHHKSVLYKGQMYSISSYGELICRDPDVVVVD